MSGTITHEWNGTVLTVTSDSGTSSADLKGAKGDDGCRGAQGATGEAYKPVKGIDYLTEAEMQMLTEEVATLIGINTDIGWGTKKLPEINNIDDRYLAHGVYFVNVSYDMQLGSINGVLVNMANEDNNGGGLQILYKIEAEELGGYMIYTLKRNTSWVNPNFFSEWEWENPPLLNGVEYRTSERYNGKPVYIKKLDMGLLADNWYTSIAHNIDESKIIDIKVLRLHTYSSIAVQLPSFHSGTGDLEACAYAGDGLLVVRTFCAQNGEWKAEAVIKYYK